MTRKYRRGLPPPSIAPVAPSLDGSRSHERGCQDKRRYPTKTEARRAAKALRRDTGRQTWPYDCRHCGAVHLTSRQPHIASS